MKQGSMDESKLLSQIQIDDLPANIRDIASVIGIDHAIKLVKLCGGQTTYIPKFSSCLVKVKSRVIYKEFKESRSDSVYSDLARKFDYSETHIRRIVADEAALLKG